MHGLFITVTHIDPYLAVVYFKLPKKMALLQGELEFRRIDAVGLQSTQK